MSAREELEKLLKLQELDLKATHAKNVLVAAPYFLKPLREDVLKASLDVSQAMENKAQLEKKILDLQNAIKSDTIYANTMEAKLPSLISNHKEYHLTAKTIEKLRKLGRDRTEEVSQLLAKLKELDETFEEMTKQKNELEALLSLQEKEISQQEQEAREDLEKIKLEREKYLRETQPALLSRYERLTKAYGHGIGIVKDRKCISCDVIIPPQTYNLLSRGEEFVHCPHCQRLLHLQS